MIYDILRKNYMNTREKKVFHSRPLFYGFLALLLAISTARYIFAGDLKYIIFLSLIFVCFSGYCFWFKRLTTFLIIISIFGFGFGWYQVGLKTFEGNVFEEECLILGRISDDVSYSKYGNSANVVLKDVYINNKKEKNIYLTIYIDETNNFEVGDIIVFNAEVEKVQLFTLENFNSNFYRDGVAYTCSVSAQNFIIQGNKLSFDEKIREKMKSVLYENMGQDNGAVAFAVLFGDKSDVDDDVYDSYKTAGIIHLLTVSGLHVGFLITLLGFILKKCKVRGFLNLIICAVTLAFYAYVCGFAPSIMRAGIMGLILLATKLSGKCYDNLNTLGLAGVIILLYSPLSALDIGFLMSFFCVLGIFVITPWLTKLFNKIFPKKIAESFSISIGTQIGILPFMATIYSQINFLTFFVNLIVIPIFSILYPILFVGAFLSALLPFLGFVLQACGWGLSLIYKIAQFFGNTFLITKLEPLNIFIIAVAFVGFFFLSKFFMANKKAKIVCCSSVLIVCCVVACIGQIPIMVEPFIVYGFNYSKETIILTNSENNSIVVDIGYENYTKSLLKSAGIKNLKAMLVLNYSTVNIDTARTLGVETIIRCDDGEDLEEELLVEFNQTGLVSGFSFEYIAYKNRLVGLEISFDDVCVFVLRNIKQSDDALQSVSQKNYDVVMLGKKDEYASYFSNALQIASYYDNSYSTVSYVKNGNVAFDVTDSNLKWRCLD